MVRGSRLDGVDCFQQFTIKIAFNVCDGKRDKNDTKQTESEGEKGGLGEGAAQFQISLRLVLLVVSERSTPSETASPKGKVGVAFFPKSFGSSA